MGRVRRPDLLARDGNVMHELHEGVNQLVMVPLSPPSESCTWNVRAHPPRYTLDCEEPLILTVNQSYYLYSYACSYNMAS